MRRAFIVRYNQLKSNTCLFENHEDINLIDLISNLVHKMRLPC